MALLKIHKIMISTALIFCAAFGLRCIALGDQLLGAGSVVLTVLLAVYFRWFLVSKSIAVSGGGADNSEG